VRTWHKEYGAYAVALTVAGLAQHWRRGDWSGVGWTACLIGANLFFGEVDSIADRNREALALVVKAWGKMGPNVLAGLADCAPKLPRKLFWGNVLLGVFAIGVGSWVGVASVARYFIYPIWRRLHRGIQRDRFWRRWLAARRDRRARRAHERAKPSGD
jgi:hypothetical protein